MFYRLNANRRGYTGYFLPKVEIIDGQSFFDQPIKNDTRTYDNFWKISTTEKDSYTTGCLLDYYYYYYFKEHYKLITIDLSKQEALMLIQKQSNKSVLLEIYLEIEIQQCFSLLKKQKN